jgi:NAD/NADP transhydrogenase alpha subunit
VPPPTESTSANPQAGAPSGDLPFDLDPKQPGTITSEQAKRLEKYFDLLAVPPEAREAALKRRGANVVRNLSSEAADELIAKLMEKELGYDKVMDAAAASAAAQSEEMANQKN